MPPTPSFVVLGANGMLGRAWCALLAREQLAFFAPQHPAFKLEEPATFEAAIPQGTRTLINCAAWTDVDGAEANEAQATAINGVALGPLLQRCSAIGARLVHYSTDYVFSGEASEPYPTNAPLAPLNAYGRSKALAETLIANSRCQSLVIRTSWLYAPWGKNFVRTIAELAKERKRLRVVDDQRGRPTSAEHLAQVSLALVRSGASGVFHVTDGGECTWYEFAKEIVALTSASCEVVPCTSAEYPRPAKRPRYSVLDLSATEAMVGPMRHFRDNLRDVCSSLNKSGA